MKKECSVFVPMSAVKLARYLYIRSREFVDRDLSVCVAIAVENNYPALRDDQPNELDYHEEFFNISEQDIYDGCYCIIVRYGGGDEPFIHSLEHSNTTYEAWLASVQAWFKRMNIDLVRVEIANFKEDEESDS